MGFFLVRGSKRIGPYATFQGAAAEWKEGDQVFNDGKDSAFFNTTCDIRPQIPFRRTERMLEIAEYPKTQEEAWARKFHFDNWIEATEPRNVPADFRGTLE